MAVMEKELKKIKEKRAKIIRAIAQDACNRNEEALRRLSKN